MARPFLGTTRAVRRNVPESRRALGARRDRGAGGSATAAPRESFDAETFAAEWVDRHKRRWHVVIPGAHYSGLSNQALLEVRKGEGRDFDARTQAQAEHVEERVAEAFASRTTKPGESQVRREATAALKEWLLFRIEREGFDVSLRPLSPAYAARKRKLHPGKPIGVARGRWLGAVRDRAWFEFE